MPADVNPTLSVCHSFCMPLFLYVNLSMWVYQAFYELDVNSMPLFLHTNCMLLFLYSTLPVCYSFCIPFFLYSILTVCHFFCIPALCHSFCIPFLLYTIFFCILFYLYSILSILNSFSIDESELIDSKFSLFWKLPESGKPKHKILPKNNGITKNKFFIFFALKCLNM